MTAVEAFKQRIKQEALPKLHIAMQECKRCKNLCATRTQVVPGVGRNVDAPLIFVGEAPGENEDIQGEPFVGRAGDLLDKLLKEVGIARESCYITNTVKCRPTLDDKGRFNRAPDESEIENCKRWLWQELTLLEPKAVVTLGKVATRLLLRKPKTFSMGPLVGVPQEVDYMAAKIVPCWHPSYLLQHGRDEVGSAREAIRTAYGLTK